MDVGRGEKETKTAALALIFEALFYFVIVEMQIRYCNRWDTKMHRASVSGMQYWDGIIFY